MCVVCLWPAMLFSRARLVCPVSSPETRPGVAPHYITLLWHNIWQTHQDTSHKPTPIINSTFYDISKQATRSCALSLHDVKYF